MRTTIQRTVLLMLLVPVVVSCGPKTTKQDPIKWGQMRDVFPPQRSASTPTGSAAAQSSPGAQSTATAQPTSATQPSAAAPGAASLAITVWPLTVSVQNVTFQVHEPVLESWDDGVLTAHALVLAQPAGQEQPVSGSVLMKAITQVDAAAGVVALQDLEVKGADFPTAPAKTPAWLDMLRPVLPAKISTMGLAQLNSGRAAVQARQQAASAVAVSAPRIIISEKPAVLVYIDGEPRYAPLKGTNLMGVVNTRALLLKDASGRFSLHLYDGWVSAASLQGPWSVTKPPPGATDLEQAARASGGRANLLPGKPDAKGRSPTLSKGSLPDIIVSTNPTALIVLDGPARYARISGTSLEYAGNTSAHLFRDVDSKSLYVRAGGYWFRSDSTTGPWSYVPLASLPAGFSAIPDFSPKRSVRDSLQRALVPAPVAAGAPTIIAADRRFAKLSFTMSGDPVMEPIRRTELNYVANASVPIIQVDIDNWYAVQDGVWFHAVHVNGPWTVTSEVPPQIYAIPPTSPIYHAIHSRVISSSTDVVYFGYPTADSVASEGGAIGVEDQGSDYQYTPPSGMSWGWYY